ncbi:MAG TPA: universal stress protein [Nocardioidaceae bacterium]|nr:universal stress protein [Nocardioidaceae bacterium]
MGISAQLPDHNWLGEGPRPPTVGDAIGVGVGVGERQSSPGRLPTFRPSTISRNVEWPGPWPPVPPRDRDLAPDVQAGLRVQHAPPAAALLAASEQRSLLVLGQRGHGEFRDRLLGSVSQHCVHHAHCPVVVVRGRHAHTRRCTAPWPARGNESDRRVARPSASVEPRSECSVG